MKTFLLKSAGTALIAATLFSCGKENVDGPKDGTVQKITIGASIMKHEEGTQVGSRANINPDGGMLTWEEGDAFDFYLTTASGKNNVFTIDWGGIGEDKSKANFTCGNFAKPEGEAEYLALFPTGKFTDEDNNGTYNFTLPDFIQTGNNNTAHLKDAFAMEAKGSFSDNLSVSFAHKTVLFRMGVTNKRRDKVTIKSLKLTSGGKACFGKSYSTDGTYPSKASSAGVSFSEEITLDPSTALMAYTLTMPGINIGEGINFKFTATLSDNSEISTEEIPGSEITKDEKSGTWKSGCYYTFLLNLENDKLQLVSSDINDFISGGEDTDIRL